MKTAEASTARTKRPVRKLEKITRFDEPRMTAQSELLGYCGRNLSAAFEAARVAAEMAIMIRANGVARDLDEEVFNQHQEDCLLSAVILLTENLASDLCHAADHVGNQLDKKDGA